MSTFDFCENTMQLVYEYQDLHSIVGGSMVMVDACVVCIEPFMSEC